MDERDARGARLRRARAPLHPRAAGGRTILEWSGSLEEAYATTLHLNNKYFFDGRDPNSFANVFRVFGLHDRGCPKRPAFGKVRYMSAGGLGRKARPGEYVEKVWRRIGGKDRAESGPGVERPERV